MKLDVDESKIQKEVPQAMPLGSIIITNKNQYQVVSIGTPIRQITPFDYLLMSLPHGYLLRHSATHDYCYLVDYIKNNLKEEIVGFISSKDLKIV